MRLPPLAFILVFAAAMGAIALFAILAWFCYTAWLDWYSRRLERRKGMYRTLVAELAAGERDALDPDIHHPEVLKDLDALEAALEEQARRTTDRPAWLLEAYDHLGLVDKYVARLRDARRWRERALAAELLGRVGNAKAVPVLLDTIRATRTEDADVRDIALRALARISDGRAVSSLVQALENAEPWLAPHIADILVRHGAPAVEPVLALLDRPSPPLARSWAANVLGELHAASALPSLLRALNDSNAEVRARSATALGRLADRSAVPPLLDHLLADPAPFVRARIANALGQFDDADVTDRLIHALGDPAWWVRVRSVEALERIGPPAERPLLAALDSGDAEIRRRAAVTLERTGAAESLAARVRNGDDADEAARTLAKFSSVGARELAAGLLVLPAESARRAMLRGLRRAGRRDLSPEIAQVALADPDPTLRAEALASLAAVRDPVATSIAADAAEADPEAMVRAAALRALGRLGGESMAAPLARGLSDSGAEVRAAAVDACARRSVREAGDSILALLHDDPSPLVRERAALAAGLLALPAGARALADACLRPEPAEVHAAAVLATGVFDHESMVARLAGMPETSAVQESLRDRLHQDPWFRLLRRCLSPARRPELRALATHTAEAAEAELAGGMAEVLEAGGRVRLIGGLKAMPGEESREALIEAARRDPSPEARTAALEALADVIEPDALHGVLREALGDSSLLVRRAAVGLFSRIPLEQAFPTLLRSLRPNDDATVYGTVADLVTSSFRVFTEHALKMPDDGDEAIVAVRVARYVGHPDVQRLVRPLARSRSPEVREAVASFWRSRPETVDAESLAALTLDPAVRVRRAAARAAAAVRSWGLLDRMANDPDATVRREVALAVGGAGEGGAAAGLLLDRLSADRAMPVRAAAYVARLLQGSPVALAPDIESREAAAALRDAADLAALREIARTAPDENQRLAAGLALALVQDQVAHEVAHSDPFPSVRHRVGGALELAAARAGDAK